MSAIAIIWFHLRACARDLHARKLGRDIEIHSGSGGQVWARSNHREWRLR